jgi:hypothetical protein
LLRRQTTAVLPALQRIHLARAFTCYQVASLLSEVAVAQLPTLVTDLLETFYDENVSLPERRTLLTQCLQELQRLSRQAEVLISTLPPGAASQLDLFELLLAAADIRWTIEVPAPQSAQLNLF